MRRMGARHHPGQSDFSRVGQKRQAIGMTFSHFSLTDAAEPMGLFCALPEGR